MSYLPTNRNGRSALGGISDVGTALRSVVEDPCLFEVAKAVSRLHDLQQKPTKPGVPKAPPTKGIGLCGVRRPLKAVTFIAERPWIVPVGITVLFGSLVGIGYMLGRPGR